MDIYSRKVLIHMLRQSIKKSDVLIMLSLMLLEYKAEGMSIRNDNGSQFIATAVRSFLKEKGILQEFSHVATPEDNAYIEALHSNLQREVIDRFEFESIYHAQMIIERYYEWYNNKRRHGSLMGKTPDSVYNQYFNPNPFENKKLLNYLWKSVQFIGGRDKFNYLFNEIYNCAFETEETIAEKHQYSFGNNVRKFLEAYLFFKYPDHSIKTTKRLEQFFGTDLTSFNLVFRLYNEFSHLEEQFDRAVTPIDIGEMKKIALIVLKKIQQSDEEQYKALCQSIGKDVATSMMAFENLN